MDTFYRVVKNERQFAPDVLETRTIDFIFSSEAKDRSGSVIPVNNWQLDAFKRNPVIGYQHDVYGNKAYYSQSPDTIIGVCRDIRVVGKKLIGSIEFEPEDINPLAEKIFKKLIFGSLNAVSVGFQPLERGRYGTGDQSEGGKNQTYYYGKVDLLEVSVVNLPANPEALALSDGDISGLYKSAPQPGWLTIYNALDAKHRAKFIDWLIQSTEVGVSPKEVFGS